jgi:hypothetical protein
MRTEQQAHLPHEAQTAIAPLWKAFAYAQDLGIDPWEFALPLTYLVDLGVDKSDLRWLVLRGFVTFRDRARRFQASTNATLRGDPRFLITEAGASAANLRGGGADSLPGRSSNPAEIVSLCSQLPHWDADRHVLYLGQQVVKRYKRPSPNQDIVLSAFEEEEWPSHIYDPLPPKDEVVAKHRLHATIDWLNRNQETRLLRFRGDGTGEGICWERVDAGSNASSAEVPKKLRHSV